MRNRLVHAYFSINLDIVWQTVRPTMGRCGGNMFMTVNVPRESMENTK